MMHKECVYVCIIYSIGYTFEGENFGWLVWDMHMFYGNNVRTFSQLNL